MAPDLGLVLSHSLSVLHSSGQGHRKVTESSPSGSHNGIKTMFFQSTFLLILLGSSCYLTECLPCAYTAAIAAAEALARARQQDFPLVVCSSSHRIVYYPHFSLFLSNLKKVNYTNNMCTCLKFFSNHSQRTYNDH